MLYTPETLKQELTTFIHRPDSIVLDAIDYTQELDGVFDSANMVSDSVGVQNSVKVKAVPRRQTLPYLQSIDAGELVTTTESHKQLLLPEKKLIRQTFDWEIVVFVVLFLILVFVRFFSNNYIQILASAAISFKTTTRTFREKSLNFAQASFQMGIFFYIIFSFFIFQVFHFYQFHFSHNPIIEYLIIYSVTVGILVSKNILYVLQGNISRSLTETREFIFHQNICSRMLALILLPISMVITFGQLNEPRLAILFGLSLTALCYILIMIRGARILMRKRFSIFYLILYLCTLEILPLMYIYKLVLQRAI